jgi:hypothetical protein
VLTLDPEETDWQKVECLPVNLNNINGLTIIEWDISSLLPLNTTLVFKWNVSNLDSNFPSYIWG